MPSAPRFESDFLEELAIAFRKRRKSFKHRGGGADLAKVYELVEGERMERLEIHLDNFDETLRLHAWPDRLLWLDARRREKKRWAWTWSQEGRLLGAHEPQRVIAALEATRDLLRGMSKDRTNEFETIWKALLARGPVAVR